MLVVNLLESTSDLMRKFRNTARFLLGNLHEFCPTNDMVAYNDLLQVKNETHDFHVVVQSLFSLHSSQTDKYFLHLVHEHATSITAMYDAYSFHQGLLTDWVIGGNINYPTPLTP